jgi:HEAT repeat protein
MGLLHDAYVQAQIWRAYLRLKSPVESERMQAMQALRDVGGASLTCLRYAVSRADTPRVQFAAAVVLHWLGERQGMEALLEALQWRLPSAPGLALELESAFITIGSPDAVTALLGLWRQLPEWGDHDAAMGSICRVWASLRDPRALDGLIERATRIPELFLTTVPAFGEMAVLALERMLRDNYAARRMLAVRALGRIVSGHGFAVLLPILRDPDPQVRALVPAALETTGGAMQAAAAISEAIHAGYSSREAVETLVRIAPPYFHETLLELVSCWDPQTAHASGHTGAAVLAALSALSSAPWPNVRLAPPLCALLERQPGPDIITAVARVLTARGPSSDACDSLVRDTLWPLLACADRDARTEIANTLARFGQPLGRKLIQFVDSNRPQGSLFSKLQTLLRGGPDAGQAATQAMQQVSQWVSRLSKETAGRLSPVSVSGVEGAASPAVITEDARLFELLRLLLAHALDALEGANWPEEAEEQLALCVAVIRALGRVGVPAALRARAELLRALTVVKYSLVYDTAGAGPFRKSDRREIGDIARAAAAETLIQLYGGSSFALFLETLYAPCPEARATALFALGRLGDVRALPHLQALIAEAGHPLAGAAQEALSSIRRTHPEIMTLLRASGSLETRPDTLLRPASGNPAAVSSDLLLRPIEPSPAPNAGPVLPYPMGE